MDKFINQEGRLDPKQKKINGINVLESQRSIISSNEPSESLPKAGKVMAKDLDPILTVTTRDFVNPRNTREFISLVLQSNGFNSKRGLKYEPVGIDISISQRDPDGDLRKILKKIDTSFTKQKITGPSKKDLEEEGIVSSEFENIIAYTNPNTKGINNITFPQGEKGFLFQDKDGAPILRIQGELDTNDPQIKKRLRPGLTNWIKSEGFWALDKSEETVDIDPSNNSKANPKAN